MGQHVRVVRNMQTQVLKLDGLLCKSSVYLSLKSNAHY